MIDNKLRCALVLRIENASSKSIDTTTTLLAKYDHAGRENELYNNNDDSKPLYGKELDYAVLVQEAIALDPIIIVLGDESDNGNDNNCNFGGFKVIQSDTHQLIYGADDHGICVAVITGLRYPSRIALPMLKELYTQFQFRHGSDAVMAPKGDDGVLTKKAHNLLKELCQEYSDPTEKDKAQKVQSQVDVVAGQMQENIAGMLQNTERAESLAEQSDQLNEQADIFRHKATKLKKDMWWKNIKVTILFGTIAVVILLIIIVPIFFS